MNQKLEQSIESCSPRRRRKDENNLKRVIIKLLHAKKLTGPKVRIPASHPSHTL